MAMRFPLGALDPGPPSPHDWLLSEVAPEIPARLPLAATVRQIGPIFDQSNPVGQGTCVADAFVGVKNHQERLQLPDLPWRYDDQSVSHDNDNSVDRFYLEGTGDATYQKGWTVKGAMDFGRTRGVTAIDGHRYLIGSYYSALSGDVGTNVRLAIGVMARPVQFGFPWYESYFTSMNAENSWPLGIMPPPRLSQGIAGGHSMYLWRYVWYAPLGRFLYCARQSWGLPFGVNGNVYLTDEHLASFWEAYVAVDR